MIDINNIYNNNNNNSMYVQKNKIVQRKLRINMVNILY